MDSETIATTDSFPQPDLISELPDPLLCSIISRLKIEEAVRTGVLSTRWNSLWKHSPSLEFDPRTMIRCRRPSVGRHLAVMDRAMGVVDGVIASHRSAIRSCKLAHFRSNNEDQTVNRWLERLTTGPLETLDIERVKTCTHSGVAIAPNTMSFREGAFRSRTLRSVTLHNHVLRDATPFRGCGNLGTLRFVGVRMSEETLGGVLIGCGRVESLSLVGCRGFRVLKICGQDGLRVLEVEDLAVERVEVQARNLRVFAVDCATAGAGRVALSCPELTEMRVGGDGERLRRMRFVRRQGRKWGNVMDFLERCTGILVSDHHPACRYNNIPIENLEELSICLDLNLIKAQIILSKIFSVCHHLKKLYISIPEVEDNPIKISHGDDDVTAGSELIRHSESMFWDMKELSDSLSHHVKVVCVKGFRVKLLEVEFVSYLIRNAPVMKRLSIEFCTKVATGARREAEEMLLSLPRASLDVDINFGPKEIEGDDGGGGDFGDGELLFGARKRKLSLHQYSD